MHDAALEVFEVEYFRHRGTELGQRGLVVISAPEIIFVHEGLYYAPRRLDKNCGEHRCKDDRTFRGKIQNRIYKKKGHLSFFVLIVMVIAIIGSALRIYPFYDRAVLYLVPLAL